MHGPTQLYYCVGLFALLDKSTKNQYKQLALLFVEKTIYIWYADKKGGKENGRQYRKRKSNPFYQFKG